MTSCRFNSGIWLTSKAQSLILASRACLSEDPPAKQDVYAEVAEQLRRQRQPIRSTAELVHCKRCTCDWTWLHVVMGGSTGSYL